MKEMDEKEIRAFIDEWSWCTIIGTDGNMPYAIEVTYANDEAYMYCGSRPGGTMHNCLKKNNNVILKVCDAGKTCETYRAISVKGQAVFINDKEEVYRIMGMIAKVAGMQEDAFDKIAEYVVANPNGSSLFKVPIKDLTGVKRDQPLQVSIE
jgi:nitroimidazol reductase NimA-like FMN-containing flavoprotein (pyridoxamine 5'-phosphate oxidase superfamily)